jgi:hypothetical protein
MGLFDWLNHAKRLSELEDSMLKLTRIVQDKDLDWGDMRARCKRLLDRTEKAAARVQSGEVQPETPNGETVANATIGGMGRLSDHQRQIQQQILKRRAGA